MKTSFLSLVRLTGVPTATTHSPSNLESPQGQTNTLLDQGPPLLWALAPTGTRRDRSPLPIHLAPPPTTACSSHTAAH